MEELFKKFLAPSIICGLLCFISTISSISFSTSPTYVKKGGKFTLTCQVPGLGVHLWYKDGKPISPNAVNKFHLEQDSPIFSVEQLQYYSRMYLTIEDADSIHTGEYKCSIDSIYPQNVIVITENMIETNEDYPGLGKVLVVEEPLNLTCNTTECPHCTVVWFKDGELLNGTDRIEIYGNNTIHIRKASYEDAGVYTCKINRSVLDIDLSATIVVQSKIYLKKFDQSGVAVQGSPFELHCEAAGGPMPQIKWYIGDEEIEDDDPRIRIQDDEELKNGKLFIEEADYPDRNYYTCEAFNQIDSVNTTTFIRVKDKLAALWPFLGICAEVAILCSIIFVYERRKSMSQCEETNTDLPADKKQQRDQKAKGQDIRQRK